MKQDYYNPLFLLGVQSRKFISNFFPKSSWATSNRPGASPVKPGNLLYLQTKSSLKLPNQWIKISAVFVCLFQFQSYAPAQIFTDNSGSQNLFSVGQETPSEETLFSQQLQDASQLIEALILAQQQEIAAALPRSAQIPTVKNILEKAASSSLGLQKTFALTLSHLWETRLSHLGDVRASGVETEVMEFMASPANQKQIRDQILAADQDSQINWNSLSLWLSMAKWRQDRKFANQKELISQDLLNLILHLNEVYTFGPVGVNLRTPKASIGYAGKLSWAAQIALGKATQQNARPLGTKDVVAFDILPSLVLTAMSKVDPVLFRKYTGALRLGGTVPSHLVFRDLSIQSDQHFWKPTEAPVGNYSFADSALVGKQASSSTNPLYQPLLYKPWVIMGFFQTRQGHKNLKEIAQQHLKGFGVRVESKEKMNSSNSSAGTSKPHSSHPSVPASDGEVAGGFMREWAATRSAFVAEQLFVFLQQMEGFSDKVRNQAQKETASAVRDSNPGSTSPGAPTLCSRI